MDDAEPAIPPAPMRLAHVVAGCDLSAASGHALQRAVALTVTHGARLTLAHVVPQSLWDDVGAPLATALGVDFLSTDAARTAMTEQLQRHSAEIAIQRALHCDVQVAAGRPAAELARLAADLRADLLVVGAHGAHPVRDLLGTTTQKLLRLAPCPVLVVKRPPPFDYARVLAPTDFSMPSRAALRACAALLPQAHLEIAHAFELPYDGLMRHATVEEATMVHYRTVARERLYLELAAWADAAGIAAVRRTLLVEHGYPPSCIDRWIAALGVDLVALAARGKSELEASLLGSVSLHAVQAAPCDVLLLRGAVLA